MWRCKYQHICHLIISNYLQQKRSLVFLDKYSYKISIKDKKHHSYLKKCTASSACGHFVQNSALLRKIPPFFTEELKMEVEKSMMENWGCINENWGWMMENGELKLRKWGWKVVDVDAESRFLRKLANRVCRKIWGQK